LNTDSAIGGRAVIACVVGGILLTLGYGAWWMLTPEHAYRVLAHQGKGAIMVLDSPEARRIVLTKDSARDAEVAKAGARNVGRIAYYAFVAAIERQPSVLVAKDSYVRVLEESHVRCESDLISEYTLVRVTSGPSRGKEGWLCSGADFAPTIWRE
jgi:hypothetical protein